MLCINAVTGQNEWNKEQLITPKALAEKINSKENTPLILNVGPMSQIRGAVKIGSCSMESGLNKLKEVVSGKKPSQPVVIYCGCCSSVNCPNIQPAYKELILLGFKGVKILEIPVGFAEDWSARGYPVE